MTEYTNHPAAELFPMMEQSELEKLAQDIKENGLLDPVVVYHEQILDGRNRLAACRLAGVEPRFTEVNGEVPSPTLYVISHNLHRRHLTPSQRGAIAAEIIPMLEQEAKKRQAHGKTAPGKTLQTNWSEPLGTSREFAAKLVQAGEGTVQRAVEVHRHDPALFEKIKTGELTATAARNLIDEKHTKKADRKEEAYTYTPDTPRKLQVAEATKKKMEVGLASVGGVCHGLEGLDVVMTVSVCTNEEIEIWATKAEQHASDLRKFARRLRGANNG